MRILFSALLALCLLVAAPAGVASAAAQPATAARGHSVSVGGAVSSPATYSARQIAGQPQVTVTSSSGRKVTGASLSALVDGSDPQGDAMHNAVLRRTIAVHGWLGSARFAAGELDRQFGNHPALLIVHGSRVDLVVPGDRAPLRGVLGVDRIQVGQVAADGTQTTPGTVRVSTPYGTRTVTLAHLRRLPQVQHTVTYQSGSGEQTHTERGPALSTVLLSLGVLPWPGTVVTASATDGYAAAVTPGESLVGKRPIVLSLKEDGSNLDRPRLAPVGDVKGGRYVSDLTALQVSTHATPSSSGGESVVQGRQHY